MKRILILTASFGEGHNTAAKSIREALLAESSDVDARICDLYAETNPRLNKVFKASYSIAINRATRLWHAIFKFFDQPGMVETTLPLLAKMRDVFGRLVDEFKPHAIVSAYPIYGFVKDELAKKGHPLKVPFFMMVTDSTEVNSAWYRRPADAFIVADNATKERLMRGGIQEDHLQVLGFPVSLKFEKLKPLNADAKLPYKILIMPSTRCTVALRLVRTVLSRPDTTVTVVTGRIQRLHDALQNSPFGSDPRCKIIGWTDQMPQLLAEHHVFIGKAGGAIVQEALAAQCPVIISHVVPGQEEGNIALVLQLGVGALANTPELLKQALGTVFDNEAALWKTWKQNIAKASHVDASRKIARFVLAHAKE